MDDSIERIYAVELLFADQPVFSRERLLATLRRTCPNIEAMCDDPNSDLLAFAHPDHLSQLKDASIPAQLLVLPGDRKGDHLSIEPALQQSWLFPAARGVVAVSPHKVLVTDMMAGGVHYKERLAVFLDALEAIVLDWKCQAIHWRQSQQIVAPDHFLTSRRDPAQHLLQGGPLNARFFNVGNGNVEGECIVDTMGLSVFGLPDIQCHFHSMDVDAVVHHLCNIAIYIFENGDVIEDGHTVSGLFDGRKWVCQHEASLAPPDRLVLDLNPGSGFAAGSRL